MADIARNYSPPKNIHYRPKQEKLDLSNMPHHLKTLLMAQSEQKLKQYDAAKICTRSDVKYTAIDTRQKIAQRRNRLEVIQN
jgi:hypothetical protein